MDTILFMFAVTLIHAVNCALVEFPSHCTTDDFVKPRRLRYGKMGRLRFTVDNPDKNAWDALKGSKTSYKTSTDDTFKIRVQCYVPLQLCFNVINVETVQFGVTVEQGDDNFTEEIDVTDPSIWTNICWSHPAEPVRILEITPVVVEGSEAQVKGLTMKYCERRGPMQDTETRALK